MPFSVKITFSSESSVVFTEWIENAFGKFVPQGTAFAKATGPDGPGFIITGFPVFLSSAERLKSGSVIEPGSCVAYGGANGEDIPHEQPYSVFVKDLPEQNIPEDGVGFRLRE